MDRIEINKHNRMLGTGIRALTGFFAGLVEGTDGERKAAATLFRKSESQNNGVTLGGLANIANNVLQAIPDHKVEGQNEQKEGVKTKTQDGFYTYAKGCETSRVMTSAESKAKRYLELYTALKDVEKTGSQTIRETVLAR